jgi:hypothetical protein
MQLDDAFCSAHLPINSRRIDPGMPSNEIAVYVGKNY